MNLNLLRVTTTAKSIYRGLRLYYSSRSLRAWGVLLRYLCRKMLGRNLPHFIFIAPTYRCQCRCVHCFANILGRDDHDTLDTRQLKSVIDQAKRLGVIGIIFSGGEPLLREDLAELVQHARKAGLLTRVDTNGLLLDRERISKLKKAGVTQFAVSIDDPDPETHDRLRGVPGTYKKAVEGIKILRELNIPCQILTYTSKRNVTAGIEKIIDLGRQLQVLCVQLIFPVAAGRWDGAFDQLLTKKEKTRVWELKLPPFVFVMSPAPRALCPVYTKSTLYVTAQGYVTPCPFVPYVMGNIRDYTLNELWQRHCAKFNLKFRGDCPMNNIQAREALKRHVESLARERG